MPRRALAMLSVAVLWAAAVPPAHAQERGACPRNDLGCLQALHASECTQPAATLETCLVFLQRLETARRRSSSADLALLLGETLRSVAARDLSPEAKERYLRRARAVYREVVRNEPLKARGYLELAEVAASGEERVDWLRKAVQAELQPTHMELLADALSAVGSHEADLEGALTLEDAYTLESTDTEKWRYGAAAWQRYVEALERYPVVVSERTLANVVIRIEEDIDYLLLQRILLEPESNLAFLGDAFTKMCDKSIAAIVTLDECMAGLELAVATAEGSDSFGARRLLAEAVLTGMRTIAGEALPETFEQQVKFPDWISRLLATQIFPVDVPADLLEARADYTADLIARADALLSAVALSPKRGDLRLKLGATYVLLELYPEALEQLRIADYLVPPEQHDKVDELAATADKAYQARFLPPAPTE